VTLLLLAVLRDAGIGCWVLLLVKALLLLVLHEAVLLLSVQSAFMETQAQGG
jgi:hypothetical protein